ncbi:MAG: hypothetical protein RIQ89_792 [Bacteroidota bacterium]|jgi:single-strand DNA-binding protein
MSSVNKVILIGNVGKDPEVKYLSGSIAVAKFPLATNETYKNKEGQKVDHTDWHNIVLWRGLAELTEKYVRKGKQVYIEGRIRTKVVGEGDQRKYYTEIEADKMTLLGGGNGRSSDSQGDQKSEADLHASDHNDLH